mmetsp:Transcript_62253/g.181859  ORF Transcript_62253/g.181859 Transcript_62253/m.181859 type:complete len:232 (+) Transcript_62253:840-1535(+)
MASRICFSPGCKHSIKASSFHSTMGSAVSTAGVRHKAMQRCCTSRTRDCKKVELASVNVDVAPCPAIDPLVAASTASPHGQPSRASLARTASFRRAAPSSLRSSSGMAVAGVGSAMLSQVCALAERELCLSVCCTEHSGSGSRTSAPSACTSRQDRSWPPSLNGAAEDGSGRLRASSNHRCSCATAPIACLVASSACSTSRLEDASGADLRSSQQYAHKLCIAQTAPWHRV